VGIAGIFGTAAKQIFLVQALPAIIAIRLIIINGLAN